MSRIEYDIQIIGGGPAGLSAAHRLVDTALEKNKSIKIAIFEKSKTFGGHNLSGAVSNSRSVKKLFPDYKENGFPLEGVCSESYLTFMGAEEHWNIPSLFAPPEMKKEDYLILSQSIVSAWMAAKLEEKVKDKPEIAVDLYAGFPAMEILYDGDKVIGVRVDNTGEPDRDNCYAGVTIFADKGFLSGGLIKKFELASSYQSWAVGTKEVWETKKDYSGKVWHTIGYPLLDGTFGGGFIYGLSNNRLAIGIVAGLDSENPNLRPPQILQNFKKHPMVQEMIEGGKILNYGASIIPEAGFYALPKEFAVDGAMIVGDALSVMDIKGFSGVDKAMESGMTAADIAFEAFEAKDYSVKTLGKFKTAIMNGWIGQELQNSRHYRYAMIKNDSFLGKHIPAFADNLDNFGPYFGGLVTLAGNPGAPFTALSTMGMMQGKSSLGEIKFNEDCTANKADYKAKARKEPAGFDKKTIYSTADIVFYAKTHYHEDNAHIDEFSPDTCKKCIEKYSKHGNDVPCVGDCTAEVHEVIEKEGERVHHMNLENCVQCRTCEIVCPERNLRVNPSLHGSGPDFSGL